MKTTRYILAFVLAVWCANLYAITSSYYTAIDGKSGSNLRDALYDITKVGPANGHSYDNLWTAYKTTDVYPSDSIGKAGKIWDMYSNVLFTVGTNQCGSYSNVGDCYNREHSLPKSWFNDATPAYYDLGHIVPTDGKVNGQRSNYPFGECASGTYLTNGTKKGLGKLGTSTFTGYTSIGKVFEPDDIYKGDFARMYFYMVVRYKPGNTNNVNLAAYGDGTKMFNSTDVNYGLTDYSVALLLKWHRQDPVSQKEIDRNNGMQKVQNNRNPFIDYPELVEYLWGNNAGQAVNLSGLTLSDGSVSSTYNVTLYRHGESEVLADKTGSFTLPTNELNACDNWVFDGWSTAEVAKTTTRPTTYVKTVNSASILWAVYAKTESAGSAPHRATMATSEVASVTFSDANSDGSSDKSSSITDLVSSASGISSYSGSKVYAGTTGVKIGASKSAGSITIELSSAANVKSVVVNAKKFGDDTGTLSVKAGSTDVGSAQSPKSTAGDLTFTATTAVSNTTTITVATSAKRAYIKSITVIAETSGGGSTTTTYYASEPEECNCSGKLSTPTVTATPSDGTITLTWSDVTNATNGYSVTIDKGVGYTTECGDVEIGEVTHSGSTNTCVITGLVNGLSYMTSVVANGTTSTCESDAGTATATPVGCSPWDITFGYSSYTLTAGGETVSPTIIGTQYGAVTYESSNTSVLTINASGVVTPVSAGTATVTAHWAGADGYCSKDVTTPTFTVNGKVTVTFDKNDGSGTTTTQQVDYNTATALTANIFSRTGYTFLGWALTADGAKVYNDGASITITAATTLYAVWQANTHKVTFSPSPTGATVKVNNSSSPVNNVSYGSTVTIVITPDAHYTVSSVTADGGVTVTGSGSNWSFTMPDKDVAITVTMVEEPKYTVNWYVTDAPTEEVNYAGEALAGISYPTIDCNGKVFVGWTATADYSDATTAPDDLFTDASTKTMPSNNSTNYYAVFAEETSTTAVVANEWTRITDISQLTDGATVMLVQYYNDQAINNTPGATSCTANAEITNTNTALRWTAVKSGTKWKFKTSANKYLSTSALDNNTTLALEATYDEWTITADNGGGDGSNNTYNNSNCFILNNGSDLEYYSSAFKLYTWSLKYSSAYPFYIYIQKTTGSTTYTGYTTTCTAPTEVTVTFNANGGTGTMTDQTISYNTSTRLKQNEFTREGYTFQGWATTADGSKAYDNQEAVTLTKNTTLYALWTKNSYNVSFTPTIPGQATITVNGSSTSPQSVEFGGTVSIAITPDVAYTVSGVTVSGGVTPTGSGNNWSFTMPASDVTVTVTLAAKPTYTVRFWDSGTAISTQTVIFGESAIQPSNPEGCEGYSFVGWWSAELASTNTTAHTWITDFSNITSDKDYYAVFKHVDGGNGGSAEYAKTPSGASDLVDNGSGTAYTLTIATGVTVTISDWTSNKPAYHSDGQWRIYGGSSVVVSSSIGQISKIVFTSTQNNLSTSEGVFSNQVWTGDANSVTFTNSATQSRITGITVTIGGGGTTYYTTTSECCPNKPVLEFAEATVNKFDADAPFTITPTVTGNNLNATLSFSSSLPSKASVNETTGEVTIHDAMSNTPVVITATLPAVKDGGNCQAKATASYTLNIYNKVTWLVNGAEYTSGAPTTQVTEGGTLSAYPTDPDGETVCGGKTFVGWTTAEYEESDIKPATLYKSLASMSSVHITENTTYYAVFAESDGVSQDEYIKGTKADLTAGQTVLIVHHSTSNALSTTESGVGYEGVSMSITDGKITTTNSAILWTVEVGSNGGYKFKIGEYYINAAEAKDGNHYLYYDEYPDEWMLSGSGPYILASSEDSGYQMEYYYSMFTTHTGTSGDAYEMDFYVPAVGYTAYSTSCGPNIKAHEVERLTSTNGQTVTSQAIAVKGSSLDGSTLTATITGAGAAQFSCVLEANTITSGGINTTYTISYKPTEYDAIHEAALTFSDGTTSSDPIILRGRSLPEQFAIVAYDGSNYYVLDGTMSGEAAIVKPLPVTVSNGAVAMCPSRAVYSMTELDTPDQNVYLVSNGKRLYGAGSGTGLNMKSLTSKSGTNWLLSTADFSTYHITNATNTDRGVMYSNSSKSFGHYKVSNYGTSGYYGNLLLLPIEAVCTCLDAPQPSVVARSTTATITWPVVTGATRYEVTCSGGSVSVSGTTATITGLTTNTNYTYTLKAVASGTDCSQVYNGGFRTTVCDDVPHDIKVTPNVTSAIVRWTADADKATVRVYSDAECTSEVVSKADMVSGDVITGLTENQNYYLKVFAGPDQTCASAAVAFNTISTAVEIVEWMTDGVKIILTGDELTATILVEDKQENKGSTTTNYADSIFISKYFEADDQNKLVAIYNGTRDTIDLSHYCLKRSQLNAASLTLELSSYGRIKPGYIAPNEEIILIRYATQSENSAEECAREQEGYENWFVLDNTTNSSGANFLNFSGPMSVGLYSKTANKFIDVVGATTNAAGTGELCQINASNKVPCRDAQQGFNDAAGFYTLEGDNYQTEEVETNYGLSTNRCLLIRKNTVKSGLNAVEKNVYTTDLECSAEIAQAFTTLSSEWAGLQIGSGSSGGETHSNTCIGMGNVGGFDYQGYYAQFDSVAFVENLINNKNPDGTITIPVPGLDTLSCSMMRIKVYEGGVEKATTEKRVPIMVHSGEIKTTNELFTKHEAAACAECDVVVFSGATLQKGEEASGRNAVHDLTLYPGSKLDLPADKGDFSVNSLIYRVEGDNVPLTELAGNLMTESQKLIVTRRITNDRYYFLSMPYDCDLADITLSNGIPAVNGVDYRLLEYDAEARAEEGSRSGVPGHWKLATGTMKAGQGYAIAVSSTKPKEIMFPMTIPSKNLTNEERTKVTNTVDILEYVGAARHTNYNWNLIAHPYITKFVVTDAESVEAYWENPSRENTGWVDDWKTWDDPTQSTDSTYTHPTDSTYTYPTDSTATTIGGDGSPTEGNSPRRAATPPTGWTESPGGIYVTRPTVTDGKVTYEQLWINAVTDIPPFTAMFIQGDGRGEMTFNMYPASPAPKRNARASRYETKDHTIFVGVSLHSTNGMSDLTSLRLRPDFGEHYKFGQDLLKFTVFNTSRPQLYIKTPDDQLAFRAISDSLAEHSWIPVGVYCRDAGEYTFSLYDKYVLDEIEAVYLHDNVTGITTNLLYGNYKIETTKQLYTNTRFTLNVILRRKVEVDTPTMIDHTEDPNAPRKFFRDGVMYIMRDGKIYDLTGKPAELDKLMLNR